MKRVRFHLPWWEVAIGLAILAATVFLLGYQQGKADLEQYRAIVREGAQVKCEESGRTAFQNLKSGQVICRAEQRFERGTL